MSSTNTPSSAPSPSASPPLAAPRARAWQRLVALLVWVLAWALGSTLVLAVALVLALWSWSGASQSLAQTLQWLQQTLPADAQGQRPLQLEGVSGTLRQGGRIQQLRWQHNGLQVQAQDIALAWPEHVWWDLLWHRRLTVTQLSAQHLHIQDERPDTPHEPLQPPQHLALPWLQQVQLQAELQALQWQGDTPLQTGPVRLVYAYGPGADGATEHQATLDADLQTYGQYRAQGRVQAQAPLALDLQVQGQLKATIPGARQPLALATQLRVQGPLTARAANAASATSPADNQPTLQATARVAPVDAPQAARLPQLPKLDATLTLQPWAALPLHSGELRFSQLDLAMLWPGAPRTGLNGAWRAGTLGPPAPATTAPQQALARSHWQLQGSLQNDRPGPWDQGSLPLEQLQADVRWQASTWTLQTLTARLAGGQLQASGQMPWTQGQAGAWQGQLSLRGLQPRQLLTTLPLSALDADLQAKALGQGQGMATAATRFQLSAGPAAAQASSPTDQVALLPAPRLQATGQWQAPRLTLTQLEVQALGAQASASGTLVPSRQQWDGTLQAQAPGLALQVDGSWGAAAGRPSQAQLVLQDLAALQNWLQSSLDRLQAPLQAQLPQGSTAPLRQALQDSRWRGQARIHAEWAGQGPWRASAQADGVSLQGGTADQPWQWQVEQLLLRANGPGTHMPSATLQALRLQASSPQHPLGVRADLMQATELARTSQGQWTWGAGRMQLQPLASRIAGTASTATTPPMAQAPAVLAWDAGQWQDGRLRASGTAQGLALSWLNAWLANTATPEGPLRRAGLIGDLGFDAQWTLDLPLQASNTPAPPAPAQARLALSHRTGDLTLLSGDGPGAERISAGLREAQAVLQLAGQRLTGQLRWRSEQAGVADADLATDLVPPSTHPASPAGAAGWQWPANAPLQGRVQASLPQIGLWSRLAPPGWRVSGRLQARATLGGTRAQPVWDGQVQATELSLRSLLDGLDFSDGLLSARLSGETLTIEQLQLRGAGGAAGGLLTGQGRATWAHPEGQPQAARQATIDLQLQARQLRLLARADRRLTLSGQVDARLRGNQLALEGQLSADQALWQMPDETTPTLGNDVVVRGTERPPGFAAGAGVVPQVRLALDLGRDFRVRGLGIDTYLGGRLQLTAQPNQPTPQLTGMVSTQRGSYRAYGQSLVIEQGRIRFNGPMDNPSLDILALRPLPNQRVGVAISGTAQAPRVRLYAEPDLPDSEKLAWLVLGRPASGAGAEAAVLQQAALALLSGGGSRQDGSLTRALGLDELSFQGETRQADGSTTAAAITLGKRVSSQLYVSYQRSVVGAMGTVAVFYDVSHWLTLRAQAGDDNAVDLIFSHRFDGQAVPPRTRNPSAP